jgi:hypothetical protein
MAWAGSSYRGIHYSTCSKNPFQKEAQKLRIAPIHSFTEVIVRPAHSW